MNTEDIIATTEAAKQIKAINSDTVHKICSGQVVLSLAIAVKELVENALDAGATTVEVKVKEYGLDTIEVSDNGSGVEESNFEGLTAKYHTSKIREFNDLETVNTFGFRGEALSSLCALSEMKIVTKHYSNNIATKLELDHHGKIVKRTACARQTGTTVILSDLFAELPVRRREFMRNIQKEFAKMCQIIQGYGLISYGKRIILSNQTSKSGKTVIMSTNGSNSLRENIIAIFGSKQNANLLEIKQPIEKNEVLTQEVLKTIDSSINMSDDDLDNLGLNRFQFDGFISSCSHGSGRSSKDRQFFFINGRPCDPKSVDKMVNDMYHRYNQNQYPFVVLNVILERRDIDVNITPDKRQVIMNNEAILRLALKKSLLNTFGNIPSIFRIESFPTKKPSATMQKTTSTDVDDDSDISSVGDDLADSMYTEKGNANKFASMLSQWRATGKTDEPCTQKATKRKTEPINEILNRNFKMKKIQEYLSQENIQTAEQFVSYKSESDSDLDEKVNNEPSTSTGLSAKNSSNVESDEYQGSNLSDCDYRIDCKIKMIDTIQTPVEYATYTPIKGIDEMLKKVENRICSDPTENINILKTKEQHEVVCAKIEQGQVILNDEIEDMTSRSKPKTIAKIWVSISKIKALMEQEAELERNEKNETQLNRMKFKSKIDPKQNQSAEQELKTEISKEDFIRMELIGQFNLGFIIVRLGDDLFIIDQHATDEKYNFETLQKTTVLQSQPLVVPQDLDITAVNELILIDNISVFEANGFRFDIDLERPITKRCKLVAKPFSRNWEFSKEDIDELLFMLQEGTSDADYLNTCRPSRIRAMFASRACRSSVMIGKSLSKTEMRRLVDQMGTIEQPWNCPHGRPTIRHLINLEMLNIHDDHTVEDVNL